MILLKKGLYVTLLALALVSAGRVTPAAADTLKIPKEKPVFVIDLPEGWTHEMDKDDGSYECLPKDNSSGYYVVRVLSLKDVHTKAELKAQLPDAAKAVAKAADIKELVVGDIEDSKNGNSVPFTGLRADGKLEKDIDVVVILHAFEPQKGKWYIIMTMGSEKADKAHEDDYNSIYDSIQTLK